MQGGQGIKIWEQFERNLFEMWYFQLFPPYVEATRLTGDKLVFFDDNLARHLSPKVIEACCANTTQLLQPLHFAVCARWGRNEGRLDQWRKETRFPGSIPNFLGRLWKEISHKWQKMSNQVWSNWFASYKPWRSFVTHSWCCRWYRDWNLR